MSSVARSQNEPEGAAEQRRREREVEGPRTTIRAARMHADFLVRASTELLSAAVDYDATLKRIASVVVPVLADWCVIYVVEQGAPQGRRAALAHADPTKEALAAE